MSPYCEGNLAWLRFQEDFKRPPPFLRRNIRRALAALTRTSMSSNSLKVKASEPLNDNGRPLKRRKLESVGGNVEIKDKQSRPLLPPGFWATFASSGKPNINFQKSLRVDVSKITADREEDEVNLSGPRVIRCLVSVAIFWANSGGTPDSLPMVERCRHTQYAKMTVAKTENGTITRDIDTPSFVFAEKDFMVNRVMKNSTLSRHPDRPDNYHTRDLADMYRIQVTLECAGTYQCWPVLEPTAWETMSKKYAADNIEDVNLQVQALLPMTPCRQQRAPNLFIEHHSKIQAVPYCLHVQFKWSTPNTSVLPLLARPLPSSTLPRLPPHNPTSSLKKLQRAEDESHENTNKSGEGRARRGRIVDTYNLKDLSAQAQGMSPRKRKAPGSVERDDNDNLTTITFSFGRTDSEVNGILKQHTFTGLTCPLCDTNNSSIDELRLHLHNDHENFKFSLRRQNSARYAFFVEVVKRQPGNPDGRIFQLGKPTTLFELEKYLNGDDSWVKAREGPHHNHWPHHLMAKAMSTAKTTESSSTSCSTSYRSSPNTSSRSLDEPLEMDLMDMDVVSKSLSKTTSRRALVPKTAKPLFHTVTKRRLEAGEEVPSSDDEKDESWFHQKHRDMLNDFADVDAQEKEYLIKWNQFAMERGHSVDVFLPDTVTAFVQTHKTWLCTRRQKFMAHMGILILQGVVTEDLVSKWVKIIRKSESGRNDLDGGDEHQEPKQRGVSDCICLEHAPLHDRVVCMGKTCKQRFFHKACALRFAPSTPKGKWKCNICKSQEGSVPAHS